MFRVNLNFWGGGRYFNTAGHGGGGAGGFIGNAVGRVLNTAFLPVSFVANGFSFDRTMDNFHHNNDMLDERGIGTLFGRHRNQQANYYREEERGSFFTDNPIINFFRNVLGLDSGEEQRHYEIPQQPCGPQGCPPPFQGSYQYGAPGQQLDFGPKIAELRSQIPGEVNKMSPQEAAQLSANIKALFGTPVTAEGIAIGYGKALSGGAATPQMLQDLSLMAQQSPLAGGQLAGLLNEFVTALDAKAKGLTVQPKLGSVMPGQQQGGLEGKPSAEDLGKQFASATLHVMKGKIGIDVSARNGEMDNADRRKLLENLQAIAASNDNGSEEQKAVMSPEELGTALKNSDMAVGSPEQLAYAANAFTALMRDLEAKQLKS